MARAKAIQQSEFPYHISARCINKEWFQVPMADAWFIFENELKRVHENHNLQIHSFVLMSNHFHMIASTPDANISKCMHQFMTRTSKALTKEGNRINETYAGRHFKCILAHQNYFLNAYKYVYRNPVAAGLCEKVEDYTYSTLRDRLSHHHRVPLAEDSILTANRNQTLEWLNFAPHPEILNAFKEGLSGTHFKPRSSKIDESVLI